MYPQFYGKISVKYKLKTWRRSHHARCFTVGTVKKSTVTIKTMLRFTNVLGSPEVDTSLSSTSAQWVQIFKHFT